MEDERLHQVLSAWAARSARAVIFDFNGTLCDDEPILLEIFDEIFREHLGSGLTAEQYDDLAGLSDREIVERVVTSRSSGGGALVEDLLRLRATRYQELVAERSPIREATVTLVRRLADHDVPMGVVTGAQRADVTFVLDASPVGQLLEVIVTEEDVTRGKPDPEGFLLGARLLEREPPEVLVFEDSVPGVQAARAAGMPCVAVAGDRPSVQLDNLADGVVRDLGDVLHQLFPDG